MAIRCRLGELGESYSESVPPLDSDEESVSDSELDDTVDLEGYDRDPCAFCHSKKSGMALVWFTPFDFAWCLRSVHLFWSAPLHFLQ